MQVHRTRWMCALVGAMALVLSVMPVGAAVLPFNGAILTPTEGEPTGGFDVVAPLVLPFAGGGPGGFSGVMTSRVIANDPSNPFAALGGLTFTYQFSNNAGSSSSLGRMTHLDFSDYVTDVSATGPGKIPSFVDRSVAPGAILGWHFDGATRVNPGETSAVLVVQTDAPLYVTNLANVIDGSVTSVEVYAPAGISVTIPEPASLGVLALAGLIAIRRR